MKEYLPIIKARSGLFRGIEESELEKLFGCLEAHKVIHRLWIMLITVTRYRVESTKIELVFVRVRRTVWISCG